MQIPIRVTLQYSQLHLFLLYLHQHHHQHTFATKPHNNLDTKKSFNQNLNLQSFFAGNNNLNINNNYVEDKPNDLKALPELLLSLLTTVVAT